MCLFDRVPDTANVFPHDDDAVFLIHSFIHSPCVLFLLLFLTTFLMTMTAMVTAMVTATMAMPVEWEMNQVSELKAALEAMDGAVVEARPKATMLQQEHNQGSRQLSALVGQLQAELEKRLNELGVATACVEEKEGQLVKLSSKLSKEKEGCQLVKLLSCSKLCKGGWWSGRKSWCKRTLYSGSAWCGSTRRRHCGFGVWRWIKWEALQELSSVTAQVAIDAVVNGGGGRSGVGGWCWCCGGEVVVVARGWRGGW
jgi:hypothetical protein